MPAIAVGQTVTKTVKVQARSHSDISYDQVLSVRLDSQDATTNTSTVTIRYGLASYSGNTTPMWNGNWTTNLGYTLDGTNWYNNGAVTHTNFVSAGRQVIKWLDSYTITFPHNQYGNANFIARVIFDGTENEWCPPDQTITSDNFSLPSLIQLSTVSVTPSTLQNGNMSIAVNRYNSGYTHTVRYRVQNNTT